MTARGGKSPDGHPGRIDPRQRPRTADGRLPVGEHVANRLDQARLPAALPQPPVVEGEDREPGLAEPPRELVGSGLLGNREPAGHDDARAVRAWVMPGSALVIPADEPDVLSLLGHLGAHLRAALAQAFPLIK